MTLSLSVLIPFHREDPLPLVQELVRQGTACGAPIEIVLFDDGMPEPDLHARVADLAAACVIPVRLHGAERNQGRARARNALVAQAQADWLLFLDADAALPPGFLDRYLHAVRTADFDAACGGFVLRGAADADRALHAAMVAGTGRSSAAARAVIGASAFCTGNLLVRRSVMLHVPFDEGYSGWGWEDVDWALSAEKDYRLVHLDNLIVSGDPQPTDVILRKFREAGPNFARILRKHPQLAAQPAGRAALALRAVPLQGALRPLWRRLARACWLPVAVRVTAAKVWRASWAAGSI